MCKSVSVIYHMTEILIIVKLKNINLIVIIYIYIYIYIYIKYLEYINNKTLSVNDKN